MKIMIRDGNLAAHTRIILIDKNFLFRGGSIGRLFWLVNEYFASILHRKAEAGDTIWQGRWIGGALLRNQPAFWSSQPARGLFKA